MIVIIDDEKWSISGILDWLGNNGYQYKHFFYPAKAWDFINGNQDIKLIITDVMTDYSDDTKFNAVHGGIEFLEKIKTSDKFKKIPVMVYTVKIEKELDELKTYTNIFFLNKNEMIEKAYELIIKLSNKPVQSVEQTCSSNPAVITNKTKTEVVPGNPAKMINPLRILHLSDLHFTQSTKPEDLLFPLIQDITSNNPFTPLDYLVISGDISNHAVPGEFDLAYHFIKNLCLELEIPLQHCIIAPGNHDLSWDSCAISPGNHNFAEKVKVYDFLSARNVDTSRLDKGFYKRQGDLIGVRLENRYPERFANFNNCFYKKFHASGYPFAFDDQAIPLLFKEHKIQFLSLNSAWEIDEWFPNRSGIHQTALSKGLLKARKQIEGAGLQLEEVLRIAVLHHPVTGNEKIKDDAFITLLRNDGIKLIMHGHVHEERADLIGYLNTREIHTAGTGSFGTPVCKLAPATPRAYYVLEISDSLAKIKIHSRALRKDNGAWDGWAIWPGDSNQPGTKKSNYVIDF